MLTLGLQLQRQIARGASAALDQHEDTAATCRACRTDGGGQIRRRRHRLLVRRTDDIAALKPFGGGIARRINRADNNAPGARWNANHVAAAKLECGRAPPDDSLLVIAFGVVTPKGTIPITLGIQLQRAGKSAATKAAPVFVHAIANYLR